MPTLLMVSKSQLFWKKKFGMMLYLSSAPLIQYRRFVSKETVYAKIVGLHETQQAN